MRWMIMSAGVVLAATSLAGAFAAPKKPPAKDSSPKKQSAEDTKQKDAEKKEAEEKSEKEKSVAEQVEAVQTELNEEVQKLSKQYRASEDDKEKAVILERYRKLQTEATDKYLAI